MSFPWKVGDILKYTNKKRPSFVGLTCEVVSIYTDSFRVKLLTPSDTGTSSWNDGSKMGSFEFNSIWKFEYVLLSPEEIQKLKLNKIIDKINFLDKKWKEKQSRKGNKNALCSL